MTIDALRTEWSELVNKTLPAAAKAKDPAQKVWPVTLNHCFGRIILDRILGKGEKQWKEAVAKPRVPAVKQMTEEELSACCHLAKQILKGDVDLVQLDEASLRVRKKPSKTERKRVAATKKSKKA